MAVKYKTTLRLYVDGVEYDPGLGVFATEPGFVDALGLAANDSGVSDHIDASLDYFRVGSSGYGSTEYFSDDFSSTGFPLWDSYSPGSPGTYLSEGAGIAHLAFNAGLIGNPGIGKSLTVPGDLYWLTAVKCSFPTTASIRSPGFTLWQPGLGSFFIRYYSNAVELTGTVFYCDDSFVSPSYVHSVNLDDGNWHTVGLHFHPIEPCVLTPRPVFRNRHKAHH